MKRKGVNYDVGDVIEDFFMRPTFDTKVVHRELEIIKNDLHCSEISLSSMFRLNCGGSQ